MIDPQLYRCRVGMFVGGGDKGCRKLKSQNQFTDSSAFNPYNRPAPIKFPNLDSGFCPGTENIIHSPSDYIRYSLQITCYSYFMLMFLIIMLAITSSQNFITNHVYPSMPYINFKLSLICMMHIKIGYFCLTSCVFLKFMCLGKIFPKKTTKAYIGSSKFCILAQLLLCLLLLNFLLIGIINPN